MSPGIDQDIGLQGEPVVGQPAIGDEALDVAPREAGYIGHEPIGSQVARTIGHDEGAQTGRAGSAGRRTDLGQVRHQRAPGGPRARTASRRSRRIARLIAESPMLNVKKRSVPRPMSTKSTT